MAAGLGVLPETVAKGVGCAAGAGERRLLLKGRQRQQHELLLRDLLELCSPTCSIASIIVMEDDSAKI